MTADRKSLPIVFGPVLDKNVEQLKILNTAIFPVRYKEQFYKDACTCGPVTQFAYHNDVVVGAIACRLERKPEGGGKLYIMTIGVLAPYRGYGIGSALLEHSLKTAAVDPRIKEAYLHVQTSNTETIEWYSHRGFTAVETIKDYYKRIECCDAVVLRRELTPPPPHVHQHGGGCCGHSH